MPMWSFTLARCTTTAPETNSNYIFHFVYQLQLTLCRFCSLFFLQVIDEFGSFDNYIWSFVNYKPIVSKFRYPRQVPVKTPKADVISKDLVRRGFRSVGPTVIYSFMQVAGITNDHLICCFRFHDCISAAEAKEEEHKQDDLLKVKADEEKKGDEEMESEICRAIEELNFSLE